MHSALQTHWRKYVGWTMETFFEGTPVDRRAIRVSGDQGANRFILQSAPNSLNHDVYSIEGKPLHKLTIDPTLKSFPDLKGMSCTTHFLQEYREKVVTFIAESAILTNSIADWHVLSTKKEELLTTYFAKHPQLEAIARISLNEDGSCAEIRLGKSFDRKFTPLAFTALQGADALFYRRWEWDGDPELELRRIEFGARKYVKA